MAPPTRLAVILGSTRSNRQGERVASWFRNQVDDSGLFDLDYIDLAEQKLDDQQSQHHPRSGRYSPGVQAFADRIAAADAFALLTPEYNHGYPASLKHALDACYAEWNGKPASIVAYGGVAGGVRAIEQLRPVLASLAVVTIRDAIAIPMVGKKFPADGPPVDLAGVETATAAMLTELDWWSQALAAHRKQQPFP